MCIGFDDHQGRFLFYKTAYTYFMQKSTLRPGTPKPRLSDLLHRRNQTVEQYAAELGVKHNAALEMHCAMHGVVKDLELPVEKIVVYATPDVVEEDLFEPAKEVFEPAKEVEHKKKKRTKGALVELASLVHSDHTSSEEE